MNSLKIEKHFGIWTINSEHKFDLEGVLIVDRDTKEIVLECYITELKILKEIKNKNCYKLIQGRISRPFPNSVTLFDEIGHFQEIGLGSQITIIRFFFTRVFWGQKFDSIDSIKFKKLHFEINYLDKWMDVNTPLDFDNGSIVFPDYKSVEIKWGEALICIVRSITGKGNLWEYKRGLNHCVSIEFPVEQDFLTFLKLMHCFRLYIIFAINEPIEILKCFSESNDKEIFDKRWSNTQHLNKNKIPEFLFSFQSHQEDFSIARIRDWYRVYCEFEPCLTVFQHALSHIWISGNRTINYYEFTNAVLNVSQAIEAFYRFDNSIKYSEEKTNFQRNKQSLISKLEKINNFSAEEIGIISKLKLPSKKKESKLFDIILSLCDQQKIAIHRFISEKDFGEFATSIVKLRNSLTHIDPDKKSEVDIHKIFNTSLALFYSMIMSKSGFNQTQISKMLEKLKGWI